MLYEGFVIYFQNGIPTICDLETALEKCSRLDLDIVSQYGSEEKYYEFWERF